MIRRREIITLLGGAAAAWPVVARAQQSGRMRGIGVLFASRDEGYLAALLQGLAPLGWSEGRTVRIDLREGGGDAPSTRAHAKELIGFSPDVLVAHGTETSRIMQQEAGTLPLIFTTVTDPVGSGLVASLARPGGNTTGFTNFEFSMAGKWLELLKEAATGVKTVAILFNPDNAAMPGQLHAIRMAASSLGLQITEAQVRNRSEIERAFQDIQGVRDSGLLVLPEFVTTMHRGLIAALAVRQRIPSAYAHAILPKAAD